MRNTPHTSQYWLQLEGGRDHESSTRTHASQALSEGGWEASGRVYASGRFPQRRSEGKRRYGCLRSTPGQCTVDHHLASAVGLHARATQHVIEYWKKVERLSPRAAPDLHRWTSGSSALRVHQGRIPANPTEAYRFELGAEPVILLSELFAAKVVRRAVANSHRRPTRLQSARFRTRLGGGRRPQAPGQAPAAGASKFKVGAGETRNGRAVHHWITHRPRAH